jgi:hypothetical protein
MVSQLAFLHIPKTGGRTMIELCRYFFRPDQCDVVETLSRPYQNDAARFVHSHFPYDCLPPTDTRLTFTLLREPGARIASYYQMCLKSRPEHWNAYGTFWQGGKPMHILDFASNKIGMTDQVDNAMVRQLHSYKALVSPKPVTEAMTQTAIQNLQTLMVGFQDDYDSFVDRLCDVMTWQKPRYTSNNQSYPYTVDENILKEIRGINKWDCMLYKWAKRNL